MSDNQEQGTDNRLLVGIDLGTSRTAVSASNGNKTWLESFVGWPKDFIAQKALGKPILFGAEALENRLSVDLCRPLEHGVIKEGTDRDEESVKQLVKHAIELVGKNDGQKVHAVVGVPAESLKVSKLSIKRAVSDFVDALMVASEPFTVAYGCGALNQTMAIDIGAGTVDFCIMHGTVPSEDDQRTIVNAGDYIDQQLLHILSERIPDAGLNINMVRRFKEEFGFVGEAPQKVEVQIPVAGKMTSFDITDDMRRACESILPGIIESTVELVAKFDPEFQSGIWGNILVAGGGSQLRGIAYYIEQALSEYGVKNVRCVEEPLFAGSDGALELAKDMPAEYWEEL